MTDSAESDAPRLTRLSDDLWLDLREVVAVRTFTERSTYARKVTLTTRDGSAHTVTAAQGKGHLPASVADRQRDEWLSANLGPLLGTTLIPPEVPHA